MATEIRAFALTVPANTPITAPVTIDCSFPVRTVTRIEWDIPPGPNGVLGFRIANSRIQVIPINTGQWIIANDDHKGWDLTKAINSGSWQVIAYNTGFYPHTIYLTFLLDMVNTTTAPPVTDLIPSDQISQPALTDTAPPPADILTGTDITDLSLPSDFADVAS